MLLRHGRALAPDRQRTRVCWWADEHLAGTASAARLNTSRERVSRVSRTC